MPTNPKTLALRAGEKEVFRRLTLLLLPLGFEVGKARTWIRIHSGHEESIYLHRFGMSGATLSTVATYRVHLAFRPLEGVSGQPRRQQWIVDIPPKGYHFAFNARNEATFDRCVTDLHRYFVEFADPWFKGFRDS